MSELKDRLRQHGSAFGCMVMEFLVPGMPAIIAAVGADFALFDMEHTGAALETMKAMVAGCRGIGLARWYACRAVSITSSPARSMSARTA